ncbi:hypothetical protein JRO89_XS01G0353100 [Xanthoceras sorbifolium]|uniref:Pectinesterase inhibitor domain-containing protein n=1 Tax=Xanthoceras sorbifolium TaxID=99658 RepID=A0ABQ8IP66_9ROSI|nr:hypothetical protein JRO89_XS01G0353100 [Xanthoceras sorbifolium]
MAPCNKFLARLVLSLTAISLFFVRSNGDKNLIKSVCSTADNVKFCISVFITDPRSESANVHGLALIAIQTALNKAQDTLDTKIYNLSKIITDPVNKQRLDVCRTDYTNAVANFKGAFGSTDKNAYWDAIDWVRKGANDVIDFQDIYQRKDLIAESPISAENNEIAIKSSAVILTVIDNLVRK